MNARKRSCANCRRPAGRLTSRLWHPPLLVGRAVSGPDWTACCWAPLGCGCAS